MLFYKTFNHSDNAEWVTLIHGAGGSSNIWFKQIREYKKHFNVLMVDLRGHGKSNNFLTDRDYTFEDVSRDVIEVLDHLNISSSHFVGISLGTIVIRVIADLEPTRVKSMVLGGAVTRLTLQPKVLIFVGNLCKRFIPYMWLYNIFAFAIMPYKEHKESRFLFVNEAKKLCQKEFMRWFKLTYHINPLLRIFEEKELSIPILYLMGSEDHMFLAPVEAVASKQRNSVLEVIENSGHVCNVDKPEKFNDLSIQFIRNYLTYIPKMA